MPIPLDVRNRLVVECQPVVRQEAVARRADIRKVGLSLNDVEQDALLELIKVLDRLDEPPENPEGFARLVARADVSDSIGRERKIAERRAELHDMPARTKSQPVPNLEVLISDPASRTAVQLRLGGYAYGEIGRAMGISHDTVERLINKAAPEIAAGVTALRASGLD